ncbi:Lymphoid-restricted membrane protein [Apis cerana cerana]|uniref:Lymphoid-restricted membrane protein n=1 Tax=Apis cerana cerana TaxID=94128 RepID=A0A2A3EGS3_APICC|nr:Lymphoid-restricted membrane protein [Apis cerana cerana]
MDKSDVGLEYMIDINSVMILDVLNYDNWNTINDRTTIDLGSDKNSYIILRERRVSILRSIYALRKRRNNREMDESTSGDRERQHRSAEINTGQKQGATCLNMANYATSNEACNLSTIPKRKLSVFYRSFDVIAQIDQEKEKETLDFRRTSSSPSVRIEGIREDNDSNDNDEADQQTSLHKRELVTYRSLIESEKFLSGSSPDRLSKKPSSNNGQASKVGSLSPKTIELSQVREDTIVDNYSTITETSIGKRYKLNNNGNYSELKRFFATRRSLSEGDCERYHRAKCRCKYMKEEESFDERMQFLAFPSFNDIKLQIIGLSCSKDIDNVYRENLPEKELERKYIAFSIGLGSDRITLHRRMVLSLRQRDQSERNFMNEIQRMQEDIKKIKFTFHYDDLCSLCTDQESIDKVEKVRHRLDMIARSAHRISCAAETLGAVYQEHRLSRAIFIGDKYLQLLRSRCENLATDIEEIKEILLKNNIMIEETSGEMGDDLPKIRYRNGLPCNNRTMMARRRASIATITRPLCSQDEVPRQRNSVSGRVTLRRPSLCFETQKWENEKLHRTDSVNSVIELRDIFEHTELRRNSIEENNNLLRNDQNNSVYNSINCDITNNVKDKDRLITKQNSFLELNVAKTVEKQLKSW